MTMKVKPPRLAGGASCMMMFLPTMASHITFGMYEGFHMPKHRS